MEFHTAFYKLLKPEFALSLVSLRSPSRHASLHCSEGDTREQTGISPDVCVSDRKL